ncbi:hypothetical protein [Micromonospora sp. DT227]|uniref:hypothetical protein n=1 Tax=Micromonospora sp. DT227 TaxID=3393433 RepID=UPI003CF173A5
MSDIRTEQRLLRDAAKRYAADGERIKRDRAAAEADRRRERNAAAQRARASGLTPAEIRDITGWSSETVRQALNPDAYDQAVRSRTQRRKANRVPQPRGDER